MPSISTVTRAQAVKEGKAGAQMASCCLPVRLFSLTSSSRRAVSAANPAQADGCEFSQQQLSSDAVHMLQLG